MKSKNLPRFGFVAFILISFIAIPGCEREEPNTYKNRFLYEPLSQKNFSLDGQAQLNELAKMLTKEPGVVTILKDAAVVDMTDSQGNYLAMSVQYQVEDRVINMVVPMTEIASDKVRLKTGRYTESSQYYRVEACEMKCTAGSGCGTCTQEVTERCKTQTCTCSGAGGECTGSIIFPS
jgi:hypothetical protein